MFACAHSEANGDRRERVKRSDRYRYGYSSARGQERDRYLQVRDVDVGQAADEELELVLVEDRYQRLRKELIEALGWSRFQII